MILEICASNLTSCLNAQLGGADRIELCENLAVGGLTPSQELMDQAFAKMKIPFHVLIRPRAGDFIYSPEEADLMSHQIQAAKAAGAVGIVIGALDSQGSLDLDLAGRFRDECAEVKLIFHRAIDVCSTPWEAIDKLVALGYDGLLTSGFAPTAVEGIDSLRQIVNHCPTGFEVIAASGINRDNAAALTTIRLSGIHASATGARKTPLLEQFGQNQLPVESSTMSRVDEIKALHRLIKI